MDRYLTSGSLSLTGQQPLMIERVLLALAVCAVLSFILAWHFSRFGATFSSRSRFARAIPAVAMTTTLVIAFVKSSLALSLGLVGALSIVRFRTPVKEPEELAYIFIAIAIGLGTGADQIVITPIAVLAILVILTISALFRKSSKSPNLFLNVDLPSGKEAEQTLRELTDAISQKARRVDLRRFDTGEDGLSASYYLDFADEQSLYDLQKELDARWPGARVSFVDQSSLPGA